MNVPLALLLALLLPGVAAAPVAFEPPMTVTGEDAEVASQAFLVAFRSGTSWSFEAESDGVGEAWRYRYVDVRPTPLADVSYEAYEGGSRVPSAWSWLRLGPGEGVSTLVVEAERVHVRVPGLEGRMGILDDAVPEHWYDDWWTDAVRQDLRLGDGPLPSLELEQGPATVAFSGLRSIEWTHAAVSCGGTCPRAEDSEVHKDHIKQFLSNGTATLTGAADFVAFLGPMDLSFQGTARLPRAVGALDCPNCTVEDDTLTVHGAIEFRNLTAAGGGLSADMGGAYSVRVGEVPVGRVSDVAAVAAAVAVLAGLALLVKVLTALISRQILAEPLEQETRRRVYEAIETSPALTRADLMRSADVTGNQVDHHALTLVKTGQIQVWREGKFKRYALPDVDRAEAMRRRAREDPDLSEVLAFVTVRGRSSQAAVARWARERFGWAPSTVQDKLHMLMGLGLVRRERDGRLAWYSAPVATR